MMLKKYNYSDTYYDGLLTGWNEVSYPIISKFVQSNIAKYQPETVLDLGCGNGIYFDLFNKKSNKIYGVDASEQSIILCKKKSYKEVELADATNLPFTNDFFDFVFTSEVLEHVDLYLNMIKEIYRVLKPNGVLILTTTCYSTAVFELFKMYKGSVFGFFKELCFYVCGFFSINKRNVFVRKWCFISLGGHYHGFMPNQLKKEIEKQGMKVIKKKTFYVIPPIPFFIPKNLTKSALSKQKKHSVIKRIIMLFISFLMFLVNLVLRIFRIWRNNVYIVAQKVDKV